MTSPRVSVIIPVYNRPSELAVAVASLAAEAELLLEVIVLDDASPTPVRIDPPEALAGKIRLVRLAVNCGAAGARQAGVDLAQGEIIAFLDSDDIWLPGKLASQLPLLEAGGLVAVSCGWQVVNKDGGNAHARIPAPSGDPADFAAGCWFCPGTTVIVPRTAFQIVGPLDRELRRLEDLDWFLRFALAGGRLTVAPVIGALVLREARANLTAVEAAARRISARFAADPCASFKIRRRLAAWLTVERAVASRTQGDHLGAARLAAWSLLLAPRARMQLADWWHITSAPLTDGDARRSLGLQPLRSGKP